MTQLTLYAALSDLTSSFVVCGLCTLQYGVACLPHVSAPNLSEYVEGSCVDQGYQNAGCWDWQPALKGRSL